MSEFICINGKNYVPSALLAGSFGYTSDYIAKLAREEKVLGLQVGRQWFVEPHSLEVFLHQTNFQKEIGKETLRLERKKERHKHSALATAVDRSDSIRTSAHSLSVLAQAVAVLCCGVFLGGLGSLVVSKDLAPEVLVRGGAETIAFITHTLSPFSFDAAEEKVVQGSVAATAQLAVADFTEDFASASPERFTILPQTETVVTENGATAVEEGLGVDAEIESPLRESIPSPRIFSDEVKISKDASGNTVIEPVFRSHRASSSGQFVLVPVSGSSE